MSSIRKVFITASACVAVAILAAIETHSHHHHSSPISRRAKGVPAPVPLGKSAPEPILAQPSPTEAFRTFIAEIARMRDPISRRSMIDRAKIRIATSRAPLLRRLQPVSPEKLDQISEILAVAEIDTNIAMLELHAANATPSRDQVEAVLAAQTAKRDANAGAILDDTEFAQYTSYWQSEPFTQTISKIADVMRAQGSTISPDLQQQILTSYGAAQIAAGQLIFSPSDSGIASAAYRASVADLYVADAMSKILSAEDLKAFMRAQNIIDFGN
jgi:hypothetical protein